MFRSRALCGLLLLCFGCVDQESAAPGMVSVDAEARGSDANSPLDADGGMSGTDAARAVDQGVELPECVFDAEAVFASDGLKHFHWEGGPALLATIEVEVEGEPCGRVAAKSDVPWLEGLYDLQDGRLTYWLNTDAVSSGRLRGRLFLESESNGEIGGIEFELSALMAGPESAERHSLLIGIDGIRPDGLEVADTPHLDRMRLAGCSTMDASTQLTGSTYSGPGWASILTGAEVSRHGVVDNGNLELPDEFPTYMARLRRQLNIRTAGAMQWAPQLTMF